MTTLSISTTKTMTYNADEAANAFALVERVASFAGSILKVIRRAVPVAEMHGQQIARA